LVDDDAPFPDVWNAASRKRPMRQRSVAR
ncbi:MAG: hypothetical protein QOI47_927, partial [Actinomycetota bacterium]|nr:hypothetical protein [Actinomycetota bacterium]